MQLTKALEQTPSASFIEALESFVTWMVNAEQLLSSEKFVVDELEVMEHQLSQYLVRSVSSFVVYLFNIFFCSVILIFVVLNFVHFLTCSEIAAPLDVGCCVTRDWPKVL